MDQLWLKSDGKINRSILSAKTGYGVFENPVKDFLNGSINLKVF